MNIANVANISFSAKFLGQNIPSRSKAQILEQFLLRLNNKSPHDILKTCFTELKTISIIVETKGNRLQAWNKIQLVYNENLVQHETIEHVENLLYLFQNQSNWFSQPITKSAAEYTYIVFKIYNMLGYQFFTRDISLTDSENKNIDFLLKEAGQYADHNNIKVSEFIDLATTYKFCLAINGNYISSLKIAVNYGKIDLRMLHGIVITKVDIKNKKFDTAVINENTKIILTNFPKSVSELIDIIQILISHKSKQFKSSVIDELLLLLSQDLLMLNSMKNNLQCKLSSILLQNPTIISNKQFSLILFINNLIPTLDSQILNRCQDQPKLLTLLKYIENQKDKEAFMLNNNSFFIQLIFQCIESDNIEITTLTNSLYAKYLGLKQIKEYTKNNMFGNQDGNNQEKYGLPDWYDYTALNYILIKGNKALMVSHNYLQILEYHKTNLDFDWHVGLCYFAENSYNCAKVGSFELNKIFEDFKIFKETYQFFQNKCSKFIILFTKLKLVGKYQPLFTHALYNKSSLSKLVDPISLTDLINIFALVVIKKDNDYNLTQEHYNQLLKIFILEQKPDTIKSQTLVCLALMFTQLSSKQYFGTESDSPSQLRLYAAALLKKAYQLDKVNTVYTTFINRLVDNRCTEMLASDMRHFISKDPNFKQILSDFLPPAWSL